MEKKSEINMDVEIGNKLIAEFMGGRYFEIGGIMGTTYQYRDLIHKGDYYYPNELKYHTSWDWLMPVVENIQSLAIDEVGEINVMIASHECLIGEDYYHPIINIERNGSYISMIYIAVVEFIKWYNENKNK